MSDVFHLSQDLSADLIAVSAQDEQDRVKKWVQIDTQIQTLLAEQPTLHSFIHSELKATFTHATQTLDPEQLLISKEEDTQLTSVLDILLQALCDGHAPEYNLLKATLKVVDDTSPATVTVGDLQTFISRARRFFASDCKTHTAQFWQDKSSQTGAQSRKSWLLDKLKDVLKAETELLSHDATLTPGQVQLINNVVRYPSLSTRAALPVSSRPAIYALTLKDESKEPPIAFAGAWVMTARDGSATVDASGITRLSDKTTAIEINAKAIAGEAVLYTPSGGLQGFASLLALEVELKRRHTQFTEFESLLELLSPTDLMRVRALREKADTSLEFTFKEIHDSLFDYWFKVHDEQRQANLEHALSLAKTVSPAQLSEHLEHVLDYVPRFKQTNALNARIAKFLGKKTREWLSKANDTDRQAWFEASAHYRTISLIAHANGEPSAHQYGDKAFLLRYARDQLQDYIQAEYGLIVDPDTVFITTTVAERGAGPIIPISAYGTSSYTAVNSLSRTGPSIKLVSTSRTLSQLALENVGSVDIDYALTATVSTGSADGPRMDALSAAQIKHIIRTVNIGDSYKAFLRDRFIDSPQAISRRDTAAQLLVAQMRVDALEAKISGDFSPDRLDRGYRWVEAILNEVDDPERPAIVEGHRLKVHQLLIGEATVRGVLIILAPPSEAFVPDPLNLNLITPQPLSAVSAIVVYTPEAPDGKRFREYENRAHMANKFLNAPEMASYLVGRVSEGAQARVQQLVAGGLRAADVRDTAIAGNFIEKTCLAEIEHALASADALSLSTTESNHLAVWSGIETAVDIVTIILPFKVTAMIALGRSLTEMWHGFDALKRGNQSEAIEHFVGMIERWVDAGVDIGTAIAKLPAKGTLALHPKLAYKQSVEGLTKRTDGAYAGIYERPPKHGGFSQYFINQQKHWFQVVYDSDRLTWRVMDMRRPRSWYRSPIRQGTDGLWRIGTPELSLLGGGKYSLATFRVREALPRLSLDEAKKLLDQYQFPAPRRVQMELALAEFLVAYKELPRWAQHYLKGGIDGTPAQNLPTPPGTSRAAPLSNKRKRPILDDEPVQPKPTQPVVPNRTAATDATSSNEWQNWGRTNINEPFTQISLSPPIYKVGDNVNLRVIEKDGKLFDILPQGNLALDNQVYLKTPGRVIPTYDDLEMLIFKNKYLQPRLAEFEKGAWVIKEPLLQKPIWHYVGSILRGMTPDSAQIFAKRLYVLADTTTAVLSQARMRMIAQTLHGWIFGNVVNASVLLGDPLAMLKKGLFTRAKTLNIRRRATTAWHDRIDLVLQTGDLLKLTNTNGLNEVMRSLLNRLDYIIYPDIPGVTELVFRRKGAQTINFMQLHRVSGTDLTLVTELDDAVTLMINKNPLSPLSLALTNARASGKLITFVGGVQDSPPFGLTQGFIYRI
ncbi:dermonecrotic toxin domain-containing protein [Pseudomonas helleri]|uniref:dermonecrotic toxin domain-containing protein n=1 Tax=Pseudomonas helleri TaxID=1608996 RepID=UPI0038293F8A